MEIEPQIFKPRPTRSQPWLIATDVRIELVTYLSICLFFSREHSLCKMYLSWLNPRCSHLANQVDNVGWLIMIKYVKQEIYFFGIIYNIIRADNVG